VLIRLARKQRIVGVDHALLLRLHRPRKPRAARTEDDAIPACEAA
jgi:hypothetical protein